MLLPVDISPTVTLRLVEEADASQLATACERNRQHLAPWEPEQPEAYFAADWHEGGRSGARRLGSFD